MTFAVVAGTFDTKADELNYIANLIAAAGLCVRRIDLGTGSNANTADVEVTAAEVAACHPGGAGAVLGLEDRGAAVSAMAQAFEIYVRKLTGSAA